MRHSFLLLAATSVSLLVASIGCSSEDDPTEPGPSSSETTNSSGGSSGASSGAVSQNDGGSSSGTPATAGTITVLVAGVEYPVVLAEQQTQTFKEATVVSLPTLWAATGLKAPYTGYTFDFVGADGFRPGSRANCKDVVFDGATFAKGYVEVASQRLTWDDDLGFSGCAFVSDLASIEAK